MALHHNLGFGQAQNMCEGTANLKTGATFGLRKS
jgi:hypothetical protein